MKSKIYDIVRISVAVILLSAGVAYATGTWSEPTDVFPNGNVDAPVNVGTTNQVKTGAIGASAFSTLNTSIDKAGDGAGIFKKVQILGGSPADGRVLTATNASGTARWEDKVQIKIERAVAPNSGNYTAVAHCDVANGYKLIGCSGGRTYIVDDRGTASVADDRIQDSGDEDSHGYLGAVPIYANGGIVQSDGVTTADGCKATSDGDLAVVYAYCMK